MARILVKLPQWGMGMNEGLIIRWNKNVGDTVEKGDELVEIEAAKTSGPVESPVGGKLVEVLANVDDEVPVGDTICIIQTDGES